MGFTEFVKHAIGMDTLESRLDRAESERDRARRESAQSEMALAATEQSLRQMATDQKALETLLEDVRTELAAGKAVKAHAQPAEPEFRACGCGAVSMRVDLLTASVCVENGRLVRRETGAALTCARCGRHWAIDGEGVFAPHRSAWPAPWLVEEQLAIQAQAREEQREASRGMRRRNGTGATGDLRLPPN